MFKLLKEWCIDWLREPAKKPANLSYWSQNTFISVNTSVLRYINDVGDKIEIEFSGSLSHIYAFIDSLTVIKVTDVSGITHVLQSVGDHTITPLTYRVFTKYSPLNDEASEFSEDHPEYPHNSVDIITVERYLKEREFFDKLERTTSTLGIG